MQDEVVCGGRAGIRITRDHSTGTALDRGKKEILG